jgi:xanthine dehydrogenase large subunit
VPQEQQQWLVYSSTQHPGEMQHWVSHALGIANNAVTRGVPAHGRRLRRQGNPGRPDGRLGRDGRAQAALPVKLRLDRDDDFLVTGKRHPFAYDYDVGFDDHRPPDRPEAHDGGQLRLQRRPLGAGGRPRDLPRRQRLLPVEDVEIASYRCKTNTQSNTAFRGFGGPQGMIVIEAIMGDIARKLGLDALDVRRRNL